MGKPFKHDELELKQNFAKLAADFYAKNHTLENELASAVLYMNLADYLAEYLVVGMTELTKEAVSTYYLGAVSYKPPQSSGFNIEKSIRILERYTFPQSDEIIKELKLVKDARNKVAHEMLKVKKANLGSIDKAVEELHDHTEALVALVDGIEDLMPPNNLKEIAIAKKKPAARK